MAVLFMEGFGGVAPQTNINFNNDPMLSANWVQVIDRTVDPTIALLEDGTEGRRCYATDLRSNGVFNINCTQIPSLVGSGSKTFTVGLRVYIPAADIGTEFAICELGNFAMYIGVEPGGKLCYGFDNSHNTSNTGANYYTTSAVPTDQWFYVEVELVTSTSSGTCNIYIDGALDSANSGVQTILSTSHDDIIVVRLGPDTNGLNAKDGTRITDIYITDGEVLGPVEIWYQPCDTAGSSAQFTPSAGSNHENVDDLGDDGDTTYNESSAPGQTDSFTHSDQVPSGVAPAAIQVFGVMRCSSGKGAKMAFGMDSGGTESLEPTEILPEDASFIGVRGPIEDTDPNTASAWTSAGANAAETLVRHVS